MPVDNGRQNKHGWWGTLTVDRTPPSLEPGQKCVFIKINRDSHFVSQGTVVPKLSPFRDLAAAEKALLAAVIKVGATPGQLRSIKADLRLIAAMKPVPTIVEIKEIDYSMTPPLAVEINILTESLFRNKAWLRVFGKIVGADDILLGLQLPLLP